MGSYSDKKRKRVGIIMVETIKARPYFSNPKM